jgi:hypothetical protein
MTDPEIRNRFTILTWAVGILAVLVVAVLGNTISLSYQVGQVNGALNVLINHVALK